MKMRNILLFLVCSVVVSSTYAQAIYVKTFGDSTAKPIIFLHGGPGYNCSSFEVTTANNLAEQGFYVVVYDRRGEGRSGDLADFTFEQTHSDLEWIMDSLNIAAASLIGHSFGGMVAITFAEKHADRVNSIILVGAPISLQESFKTIIRSSEILYETNNDKTNLSYINLLKSMDTATLEYSSYCFMHAMQNGFYATKKPSSEAKQIYQLFKSDSILINYASKMGYKQPQGFWKNESYTTMDLSKNITDLVRGGMNIAGMYGKEDGLYSEQQISNLKTLVGNENLIYLDNCSHSVFIDQQQLFIDAIKNWVE